MRYTIIGLIVSMIGATIGLLIGLPLGSTLIAGIGLIVSVAGIGFCIIGLVVHLIEGIKQGYI